MKRLAAVLAAVLALGAVPQLAFAGVPMVQLDCPVQVLGQAASPDGGSTGTGAAVFVRRPGEGPGPALVKVDWTPRPSLCRDNPEAARRASTAARNGQPA